MNEPVNNLSLKLVFGIRVIKERNLSQIQPIKSTFV